MLLSSKDIKDYVEEYVMITPFIEKKSVKMDVIPYGLDENKYIARLSTEFKIHKNTHTHIVDPKHHIEKNVEEMRGAYCIVPAHGMVSGTTIETICLPSGIIGLCSIKARYAKLGLSMSSFFIEPEYNNQLDIILVNNTSLPIKVYCEEGVVDIIFLKS